MTVDPYLYETDGKSVCSMSVETNTRDEMELTHWGRHVSLVPKPNLWSCLSKGLPPTTSWNLHD